MQKTNISTGVAAGAAANTVVQVIETETCTVLRELDASTAGAEKVAEGAMRNLDPHRYFTRVVGPRSASPQRV
jgi:hypothetical protein